MKHILTSFGVSLALLGNASAAIPSLNQESRLGINGIGPVRIGMTIAQAEQAAGRSFIRDSNADEACSYASAKGLAKVSFMVIQKKIVRVDINNPRVTTLRGAKIGDSEAQIKKLYPGQIKVTPHPYDGQYGHYLTYYPKDRADQNYRMVFETSKGKVVRFRGGIVPGVEYIEGCS